MIPDGMITDHFSWQEAFHTSHREIENTFGGKSEILQTIERSAVKLEKVRSLLGHPLTVTSWFRNAELNAAVGGAKNSDHMQGCAIDFICPSFGSPLQICQKIIGEKELIGFKQLILEHTWVHISFPPIPNVIPSLQVLSLLTTGGYANGLTDKYGKTYA